MGREKALTFGSLFAGIGGFDLGLERAGMTCKWQVEIDPYCQKVLAKHWPHVKRYGDIRQVTGQDLEPVDLICGGFPCQPFSVAGKRKGKEDDRYLWPEMLRIIAQARPAWVLGENVTGIIGLALDQVLLDLEAQGYATRTFVIPACAIDAPHRRDRVWIVGYAADAEWRQSEQRRRNLEQGNDGTGEASSIVRKSSENVADAPRVLPQGYKQRQRKEQSGRGCEWLPEPDVGRVANGVPSRVDRLRALGNAVVPQVVEVIGRAICQAANNK